MHLLRRPSTFRSYQRFSVKDISFVNYNITTVDGRVIRQKMNICNPTATIDLSKEGPGIYFLKIEGQGFIRVFKLVKE
jgi:hypothetical protein